LQMQGIEGREEELTVDTVISITRHFRPIRRW
jgi:hypothetical protein